MIGIARILGLFGANGERMPIGEVEKGCEIFGNEGKEHHCSAMS
jgi:hypothetical protein